ncbi:MAG: EAL domain-containing protein [Deltaproteobacteria bacterium]|nr:EAL domain-containing protein [Deltaproteobacteria bacterium]
MSATRELRTLIRASADCTPVEDAAEQHPARDLERLAYYDPVTGLPNRILFHDRLVQSIKRSRRYGRSLAVLFLDLDGFKRVNDTMGHGVGDRVLAEVGRRVAGVLRATDTVSRLGGDEFAVLLPDVTPDDAAKVASKIIAAVRAPLALGDESLAISTSVGIAISPQDAASPEELLHLADGAMYEVKASGRDDYRFHSPEVQAQALALLRREQELRRALAEDQLVLHYQPLFDLRTGQVRTVEALLRWNHPRLGLLNPGRFLPLAEHARLIPPLGQWVMTRAFRCAQAWRAAGDPAVRMAVNMAPEEFELPNTADRVAALLIETGFLPSLVEIEITETTAMANPEKTAETLADLWALGIRVAIDDFGTGYSSLSYLQRFPLSTLKMDRSFIRCLIEDPGARTLVSTMVGMAHCMNLEVVAEGVETRAQLEFLINGGCDLVQGFLTGRPMPEPQLRAFLKTGRSCVPRRTPGALPPAQVAGTGRTGRISLPYSKHLPRRLAGGGCDSAGSRRRPSGIGRRTCPASPRSESGVRRSQFVMAGPRSLFHRGR